MAEIAAFIHHLFDTGEGRLRGAPVFEARETSAVVDQLAAAYAEHALTIAGPPLAFAPEAALAAAQFLAWSCWFLLHRREEPEEVESRLVMPGPISAVDHLSADLTLRFAATVHRRARAIAPQDILLRLLDQTLRRWPLSGALADIAAGPEEPADLGGHPGLLLLFAERLAAHPRPAWLGGAVTPYAELVFARRGMLLPALAPTTGVVA